MVNSGLFIDVLNLNYCVDIKFPGRRLDYELYLKYLKNEKLQNEIGELKWKFAYGTQKVTTEEIPVNRFVSRLKYLGFDTKYLYLWKDRIITIRADFILDVVKIIDRVDTVILGVNNHDYIPLIEWIQSKGLKCGIYAARISKELKERCNFFIEIGNDHLLPLDVKHSRLTTDDSSPV